MNSINLRDIITEEFQNEIQDSFAFAIGFGVVFTDEEGNHIGPGGNFCRFCNKINETEKGAHYCALSNKHAIEIALATKKPSIYICHAGLVNIEIPLIYKGSCVGAITAGQVLCSEENAYPEDKIASEINWLSDPVLAAYYEEIEIMNCQQIEATTTALANITNYIIQRLAYARIQEDLARKSEELLKAENKRIELVKQLKQAQLDALQKQVTPHFIFNVINSISRLLSLKEYGTAQEMLSSFSQMLRYSLSDLRSAVPLQQELDYISNYLAIQNIRFGERIHYEITCDEELKSFFIPFFSLQPLVENSIEHGLLCKEHGGKLILKCIRRANHDLISISDNGVGIPARKLNALRFEQLSFRSEQSKHVGLHNSYRRFRLMFGSNMTFSFDSREGIGTKIAIKIYRN